MKFNVIVGNPPYKGGLHMDIFNRSFDILEDMGHLLFIHPSTPFLNRKPSKIGSKSHQIKKIVSDYKSKLKLMNGNKIFNAEFSVPLSITHIQNTEEKNIEVIYSHIDESITKINKYDSVNNIFIHGDDIILDIHDKINNKMGFPLYQRLYRYGKKSSFYLKINRVSGHEPKDGKMNPDFYQLLYKADENNMNGIIVKEPQGKNKKGGGVFNELGFDTKEELKNGFEYLLTKFVRFCVSLKKTAGDLNYIDLSMVPYMDFSRSWTDEQLYEYFELTRDEIDFIEDYIQDWYDRDFKKTKEKFGKTNK